MRGFNFTEDVRRLLATAREEANRLHHEYVGTEHILLGFTTPQNVAPAQLLRHSGGDPGRIRATIEETIRQGPPDAPFRPDLPYTSRAKKVLELAMLEASQLQHSFVGPGHLLLGLIREDKGIAAQVLATQGVRVETVQGALRANHPPDGEIDKTWQSSALPAESDDYTVVHVRGPVSGRPLSLGLVLFVSVLWAALWVYLRPDILNWRLLALLLVIVVPPILLLRLTRPR